MKSRIEKNHDRDVIEQFNNDKKHSKKNSEPVEETPVISDEDKLQIKKLYEQYVRDDNEEHYQQTINRPNKINLFLNRGIIILTLLLIIILIIAFFF